MSKKLFSYNIVLKGGKGNNGINRNGVFDIYSNEIKLSLNGSQPEIIPFTHIKSISIDPVNKFGFVINYLDDFQEFVVVRSDDDLNAGVEYVKKYLFNLQTFEELSNPLSFPQSFNCTIIENVNTLYSFERFIHFKQDITSMNKSKFDQEGLSIIYDNSIRIENIYYSQNIPFYIIKEIEQNIDDSYSWNIKLNNDEMIIIKFDSKDNLKENLYKYISKMISMASDPINNYQSNIAPVNNNNQVSHQFSNYPTNQQNPPMNQFNQPINNGFNQYNQNIPRNEKSVVVLVILHLILIGLGYAYVDKWGKFLAVLFCALICVFTIYLLIPALIMIILWIYALFDGISMVEKYNRGELY